MIPNAATDVKVTSNLTGETGQFTVDENSLGKIMSVLTNLYSDPEGAVVREYLTNAYDAQIDAGMRIGVNWRPIEVTTPSHFSKEYKVRDFGIGLSVDDIRDVYSKYGKSTKESSNDVTGMLGLGSKCALTYTGQFTITGYKNGVRTRATVSINEDHIPEFSIVDTRASDEPNGVEIAVPVRDRNSFAEKAQQFLRYWPKDSVLVNSQPVKTHDLKLVKNDPVNFNIAGKDVVENVPVYVADNEGQRYYSAPQSYVVMGNVAYAIDAEYVDEDLRSANMGFVAYVPMGAVDFPPNREKLMYNTRTKRAVKAISKGLYASMLDDKLKEITGAPDFRTAWQLKAALPRHFATNNKTRNLKYKGVLFPERIVHAHMELDWDWQGHGQIGERTYLNVATAMNGTLVVTGVTQGTKPTSYFKKKVRHYMETNSIKGAHAILVDADFQNEWLDWVPRIDADTIKAIKLPKAAPTGQVRAEAPYEYYVMSGGSVSMSSDTTIPVPAGKTLVYISPQDMRETYRKQGTTPSMLMSRLGGEHILAVMGKNRFEKFLRSHPTAVTATVALQKVVNDLVAKATPAEYIMDGLSHGEQSFMKSVNYSKLNDPELVSLAKVVQDKSFKANYASAAAIEVYARRAQIQIVLPPKPVTAANPCHRYPLIDNIGGRQLSHMVIYCNAVYDLATAAKP